MSSIKKRKNSRAKGSSGEREAASLLCKLGFPARRTAQVCGKTDGKADIEVSDNGMFHWEVKREERLNIDDALNQATRDAEAGGQGKIPLVLHRKNGTDWKVTLDAVAFITLLSIFRDVTKTFSDSSKTPL